MREIANRSYHKNKEANREKRRLRSQAWRDANPALALEVSRRYQEANREKCRERCLDWQRRNPEKVKELVARYEARKKGATIGTVDYAAILERDGLWCYLCETEVEPDDVHFDHVIPLSKGGAHSMENIKVTHSLCNLSKGDRLAA